MKLLSKTNIYFSILSLVVFFTGGIIFYFLLIGIIDRKYDDKLHERKNYVIKQIKRSDSVILFQKYSAHTLSVRAMPLMADSEEVISDTVIYDDVEHATIVYRQLAFIKNINGKSYKIQLRSNIPDKIQLIEGEAFLIFLLIVSLVAGLAILNNTLSRILWAPFYQILDKINNYRLDHAESLRFPESSINEFNELAADITKMTEKLKMEFNIQKEFLENASHELQTPLAIISNKLELLLQTSNLNRDQLELINSAMLAVRRLSKLNEALLIISRIENRQFHDVEDISINQVIDHHFANLDELIQMRSIKIRKQYIDRITVRMNPYLAEILLENLITNAIKHNDADGEISITTTGTELLIANRGPRPVEDTTRVFQRFTKLHKQTNSVGLGLSIVKGICDTYGFEPKYRYEDSVHQISIQFSPV